MTQATQKQSHWLISNMKNKATLEDTKDLLEPHLPKMLLLWTPITISDSLLYVGLP